jgi:hypothetical protein
MGTSRPRLRGAKISGSVVVAGNVAYFLSKQQNLSLAILMRKRKAFIRKHEVVYVKEKLKNQAEQEARKSQKKKGMETICPFKLLIIRRKPFIFPFGAL